MTRVRVLAGTHKGAFIITSDAARKDWHISGPHLSGIDVYHIKRSPPDPTNPERMFVAISAAGAFRTDDGGQTWKPINKGLKSGYELPDADADVGHCVHNLALHPSRPDTLFMQKHWDVLRTDNAGDE